MGTPFSFPVSHAQTGTSTNMWASVVQLGFAYISKDLPVSHVTIRNLNTASNRLRIIARFIHERVYEKHKKKAQ